MEKLAKALGVEIKDLFEFVPEAKGKDMKENINKLLEEADENKLRLIFKIVRTVVR